MSLLADLSALPSEAIFAEARRRLKCQKQGPKRVVLIGPPGCGKGAIGCASVRVFSLGGHTVQPPSMWVGVMVRREL